jgi:hypothetical protein
MLYNIKKMIDVFETLRYFSTMRAMFFLSKISTRDVSIFTCVKMKTSAAGAKFFLKNGCIFKLKKVTIFV